jgi:chorismate mutase
MENEPQEIFAKIEHERNEIDRIDAQIVELFSQRLIAALKLGQLKRQSGLPIEDSGREEIVLQNWRRHAENFGIPSDKIDSLVKAVIAMMKSSQEES